MYHKIGTIKQLEEIKEKISLDVYDKIYDIISVLDREYGADRNFEDNDGGFVIYADSQDEIDEVRNIMHLNKKVPELVDVIGGCTNVLYLKNNEFGINFIAPRKSKNLKHLGVKYDG